MVVPKFSYITGFGIQVFAIIFMMTEHNVTGGLILFFTGDIQMLLSIGFSDEKLNVLYSVFDISISSVYLGFYIYIYYMIISGVTPSFLPFQVKVLILFIQAYGCFRVFFPLMNLKKGEFVVGFFAVLFVCWLIPPFFLADAVYLDVLTNTIFIQIIYMLIGTMVFCVSVAQKQVEDLSYFKTGGYCTLGIIVLVLFSMFGPFTSYSTMGYFGFLYPFQTATYYFYGLIGIWAFILVFLLVSYKDMKVEEDPYRAIPFVIIFYIILLMLIFSIFTILAIIGVF